MTMNMKKYQVTTVSVQPSTVPMIPWGLAHQLPSDLCFGDQWHFQRSCQGELWSKVLPHVHITAGASSTAINLHSMWGNPAYTAVRSMQTQRRIRYLGKKGRRYPSFRITMRPFLNAEIQTLWGWFCEDPLPIRSVNETSHWPIHSVWAAEDGIRTSDGVYNAIWKRRPIYTQGNVSRLDW